MRSGLGTQSRIRATDRAARDSATITLARPLAAMNRNDWVFVGVRLLGVFLLAEGLVALPMILAAGPRAGAAEAPLVLGPLLHIAVGVALAVGTARICRWLGGHGSGQ